MASALEEAKTLAHKSHCQRSEGAVRHGELGKKTPAYASITKRIIDTSLQNNVFSCGAVVRQCAESSHGAWSWGRQTKVCHSAAKTKRRTGGIKRAMSPAWCAH